MTKNTSLPLLTIVVPCYNEKDVLSDTCAKLTHNIKNMISSKKISGDSSIYFVDDGSTDKTWSIIEELSTQMTHIHGIKLSCNKGHQNALLAGLLNAPGDAIVSIDADLQDEVGAIEKMVDTYLNGHDIVYGVRSSRTKDSLFKRFTAEAYYKLLKSMGVNVIFNHADFRLISRRVISALEEYQETNLFLRGLIPSIGYPSSVVTYDRKDRTAGSSKYPLKKMLTLALNGITSYTSFPLRLIAGIGLAIFLGTIALSLWVLWASIIDNNTVPGWASSVLPMYLLGGIQLFSIGVLGEYIGNIYMETKKRPRYIIEKII